MRPAARPLVLTTLGCLAAAAALASPAAAELAARGDFDKSLDDARAGWAGPWKLDGPMALDPAAGTLAGQGTATRPLLRPVDFAADGETFVRYTVTRTGTAGAGKEATFASLALFNRDAAVGNRPAHLGVSSRSTPDFGLVEHVNFGDKVADGESRTLVARLVTRADGPDVLEGWVFPAGEVPAEMPEEHDVRAERDYGGSAGVVLIATGKFEGMAATFEDLRFGTDWASVAADELPPAPEAGAGGSADHGFRALDAVRVADTGTHALPIHWSQVGLLPGAAGGPPSVLIQSDHGWMAEHTFLYRPAGAATAASAEPAPNPALPLYAAATHDSPLPPADYQAVPRAGDAGGFDLFDLTRLHRVATIDAAGTLVPLDDPQEAIAPGVGADDPDEVRKAMSGRAGATRFIADADGDGVPDLLLGQMVDPDELATYWPRRESPWILGERDNVGPDADLTTGEGFRGYDVAGHWLGTRRTAELSWMRGARDGDRLTFGPRRPVYVGRDDVAVQWRTWSNRLSPAVVNTTEGGRARTYIALFAGDERPLALPVLGGTAAGELRVGRATPLLADGEPLTDLFLTVVRASIDLTGDGRPELVAGTGSNGRLTVIGGDAVGQYRVLGTLQTVGGELGADTLAVPARGDWDGDGLPDLVTGDGTGYYLLWPGTPDPLVYGGSRTLTDAAGEPLVFKGTTNLQGPHESGWSYSQPGLFDWDGDGDLELIGNDNTSTLRLHDRVPGDATRVTSKVFTTGGHKLGVGWRSRMAGVSGAHGVAGDDRPALLFVGLDGALHLGIPAAKGSTEIERTVPLMFTDGDPVVTAGQSGMAGRTQLSCPDWDGDGVWDVMYNVPAVSVGLSESDPRRLALDASLQTSAVFWLRNAGTNAAPSFERPRRVTHKDGGAIRVEKHSLNVEPTDLDGDGELDLLVGDGPGFVYALMRGELAWDE